jgi:tetratricopeptide (TPR) repeat protein
MWWMNRGKLTLLSVGKFRRYFFLVLGVGMLALTGMAWVLYRNSGDAGAEACFERAFQAGANGDFDKSIGEFTEIIRRFPEKAAEAYLYRANTLALKGDHERAIADFTQVLQRKPNWDLALFNRGRAYEKTGRYDLAVVDYGHTLAAIDPAGPPIVHKPGVLFARGEIYLAQGKKELALADFTEAIALDTTNHHLYEARAKVNRALGRETEAVADETKASDLRKKNRRKE